MTDSFPAGNCMFKINYRNTRTRCEICCLLHMQNQDYRETSFLFFVAAQPIFFQCNLSLSSENIKKLDGFLMFAGCRERIALGKNKLRDLRNCILRSFCAWSLFCSMQVYMSFDSLPILLCFLSSNPVQCSKFGVIFIDFTKTICKN